MNKRLAYSCIPLLALAIAFEAYQFPVSIAATKVNKVSSSARNLSPGDGSQRRTMGDNVLVGSFTMHVQIQQNRVVVMDSGGANAAAVPATQLTANFVMWDPNSRTATINVAIGNTGRATLFGPLKAIVTKVAPPKVVARNTDSGTGPGSWQWTYGADTLGGTTRLFPASVSGLKEWKFQSLQPMDFQVDVEVLAGVPLAPGIGGTVVGSDGTRVTVQPDSIPYEVLIDISSAPRSAVSAPLGALEFVGAANLTFEPSVFNSSFLPPNAPLQISLPAPPTLTTSNFVVGQQMLSDSISGSEPGLQQQLVATDTASLVSGSIVTEANIFPGIFGGGLFVFVANHGSGFATGTVSDASGPRGGAVVSNTTNTLVSVTDGAGHYTLYINGGPFTVTGFDPFRGSMGSGLGNISVSGSTVVANISLAPLATPPVTRDGIRNGGFERGNLTSWASAGAADVRQQFGPTSTGVIIRPTEGQWMADINTGLGAVGGVGSSLKQQFVVPAGVGTFRFDFDFISEEFPEFVGSIFDDSFRAVITTPNGQSTIAQVSVNQSGGFTLIGDCGFPGGDNTCGHTGWRQGSVDLSAFAGTGMPIMVDLIFSANDAGDNIYDTHVLIDNLRFSTLWVDVKIITGSAANVAMVRQTVRDANEILSQAGLNVRIRNVQTVADPGGLLDTDITWTTECRPFLFCLFGGGTTKGVPTAEELALLALARSATATDLNSYFVRSFTGLAGIAGIAIGPDDFHDVNILTNSGIIQADVGLGGNVMAHEIGHILISPQRAGDVLEHSAPAGNFLSTTPVLGTVNRQQSANINRVGAPLPVS
jgi:hypothetical protein